MSDASPLMPHATAAWLVENTGLTFLQIAEFCGLHILEVQAIADETTSTKYTGRDPVSAHELSMKEIEKGQADPAHRLEMTKIQEPIRRTRGPRYTPLSKRQEKPDGIAWILKNHPEISDGAISKLIGTTRNTINAIRQRDHWNSSNIVSKDPVTLGLCSQRELDALIARSLKKTGGEVKTMEDERFDDNRQALLEELRAERAMAKRLREASEAQENAESS